MCDNNFICKWWNTIFPPKNIKRIDINEEYISSTKSRFLKLYEPTDSVDQSSTSSNIEPEVYDKKKLADILSDSNNHLEKIWKTRLLVESITSGNFSNNLRLSEKYPNIVMFYDIYKQGFSYYCDQPIVPYDILNSVAMKYVMRFRCLDFFMDETVIPNGAGSRLKSVFLEEEKKEKKPGSEVAIDLKDAPFAKLKNYAGSRKDRSSGGGGGAKTPVFFRTNYPWFWKVWFRIQYYVVCPVYRFCVGSIRFIGWNIIGWKLFEPKPQDSSSLIKGEQDQTPEPEKIRNKFIYLGRFRNLKVLQTVKKPTGLIGGPTKYDALFQSGGKAISYKDFKTASVSCSHD